MTLQDLRPTATAPTGEVDWGAISEKLVSEFPAFTAAAVIAEIVRARDAAVYVGTAVEDLAEVVEFIATYALRVHAGEVTPSSRLDPETHASPRARSSEASVG